MRQSSRRRQVNRVQRSELRTAVKKVRQATTGDEAQAAFQEAERLLDRAARKGLIAKNMAARNKQRLHKAMTAKAG